jgi:glucose-inhibited division protein A
MRNFISTPNIGLKRKLATRFTTYSLDEFRTSMLNCYTEKKCSNLYLPAPKINKSLKPGSVTHTDIQKNKRFTNDMMKYDSDLKNEIYSVTNDEKVLEQIEIQIKYAGYIQKEFEMVKELEKQENMEIPEQVEYSSIKSLSTEGVQKLSKVKPETIGQASRISGVSASDVSVLMVYLKN